MAHSHGRSTLGRIAYILVLIGAILLIVFGVLTLIGSPIFANSPVAAFGGIVQGIIEIILGIICLSGARYVTTLVWAIVLLIVGINAGGLAGDFAGILVIIGAILGLIDRFL
ncbi:MAG: hypothetical protein ACFCUE_04850 [Candidatus Bathyarchaeia archaeon]|jgi:carbon starvation protein CstA